MVAARSIVDTARHDAQALSRKIGVAVGKAEAAAWEEVKALQGDLRSLAVRMQSIAKDQADTVRTVIHAAIADLEAAVTMLDNSAIVGKDEMRRANLVIAGSVRRASESLSAATDAIRTKLAHAIAPAAGQP